MSGAAAMRARLGVGRADVPASYDWDARHNVVNDGANRASQWTDTIAAAPVAQGTAGGRPAINTVIAASQCLLFSAGTGLLGPIAGLGPTDVVSVTLRVRFSSFPANQVLFRAYHLASQSLGRSGGQIVTNTQLAMTRGGSSEVVVSVPTSPTLVLNAWYTLGFAWAADVSYFHQNGVLVGSTPHVAAQPNVLSSLAIGNQPSLGTPTRGYLGRIKVYVDTLIPAAQHLKDHQTYSALWS